MALRFDRVGMTFPDGTEAIEEGLLDVDRGEFVTVVGPSGCGKSTLLRIAAGLLTPTAGRLKIDRDHLGYVIQEATLVPFGAVDEITRQHLNDQTLALFRAESSPRCSSPTPSARPCS